MPVRGIKVGLAIVADWPQNWLVTIAMSLERSQAIDHFQPHLYQSWKFGKDLSSTFWDIWFPMGTVQKETKGREETAAEQIARGACRQAGWAQLAKKPCFLCVLEISLFHVISMKRGTNAGELQDSTNSIVGASLSISIASGALMVQNIRVPHLSVRKSELWKNGW